MKNAKVDLYKKLHKSKPGYGNSLHQRVDEINELVITTSSKTLLDFGSGKGIPYKDSHRIQDIFGIMPTLYDPAIDEINILPKSTFDGIFSTDVMEHIPEDEIDEIFDYMFTHANKFVYIGICVIPAYTILSNGENAHCTVRPFEWWKERIAIHSPKMIVRLKCYEGKRGEQWEHTFNSK